MAAKIEIVPIYQTQSLQAELFLTVLLVSEIILEKQFNRMIIVLVLVMLLSVDEGHCSPLPPVVHFNLDPGRAEQEGDNKGRDSLFGIEYGHTYFHRGGTHPQCNPTNRHTHFF